MNDTLTTKLRPTKQRTTKKLAILGSTGSVGRNALDVVSRHPDRYEVTYLTTFRRIDLLAEQIEAFHPKAVVVLDPVKADILRASHGHLTTVLQGSEAMNTLAASDLYDTLIGALVGFAGLEPTIMAIRHGKRICIANKETLVVAGELLTELAAHCGAEILPIDSEHSAIAQCIVGEDHRSIKKLILTASGGPFRTRAKETFADITLQEALKHPNWVMGNKITIDSATLMNKGLEIIEARWLFAIPYDRIEVIVHPQSIVHSMVEFVDGSVKAQLGAPDMRLPIQYALEAPERLDQSYELLNLLQSRALEFSSPDTEKFPCLKLARDAGQRGGLYPCVLNAANEVAVAAFLSSRIAFTEIPRLIEQALTSESGSCEVPLDSSTASSVSNGLERIFETDARVRIETSERIEHLSPPETART